MNELSIYVLVLNYNSSGETLELYENLKEFKLKVKLLVIDNCSSPKDQEQLKANVPEESLIINKRNLGYAGGNNVGIDVALKNNADYIWILNPDIRIEEQTLPILLETIVSDEKLAAIGPRIIRREDKERIYTDGEILKLDNSCQTLHKNHNFKISEIQETVDYDIDYIDGSSILLNCKAIRQIGKLPEEYFLYFEETDWCTNAKRNNWQLAVNTNARVYNLTSSKNDVYHYYMMRNKLIFSDKYHPDPAAVKRHYCELLLKEVLSRFRGKYFKPFYKERVKGLFSGLIKTSRST